MRDRLRTLLQTFWSLRSSTDRRVRVGWHLGIAMLLLVAVGAPRLWDWLFDLEFVVSVLLCSIASVWGLFHPRSMWPARRASWRWAAGVTVVSILCGYAGALDAMAQRMAMPFATANLLSAILVFLVLVFGFLMFYGWLGAAVSAYFVRDWPESERLTGVGVTSWWLLTSIYLFGMGASMQIVGAEENPHRAFLNARLPLIPLLTILACALARNPEWELRRLTERALQRLSRYLTFRWRWRDRALLLDLRGALLGFLVAGFVFSVSRSLLKAPSASLLVWMIQARNQEARGAWNSERGDELTSLFGTSFWQHDESALAPRRKIVLLDLDMPTLRAAVAPSEATFSKPPKDDFDLASVHSEAALQALLIRRLRALHASIIVLSPPQQQPEPPSSGRSEGKESATTAKISLAGRERSRRDEALLVKAMREAGNVVLAVPKRDEEDAKRSSFVELIEAAEAAGDEQLGSYGSIRLPVLQSEGPDGPNSLPVFIAQSYAAQAHLSGKFEFKKHTLVPVDFRNAKPGHDFLRVPASSLFTPAQAGAAPANPILTPSGDWKTLEESVRGKIVFIESPDPHFHETPIGALPTREVLAYGTATVLAHQQGARVPTARSLYLTLLIGTIMGILCAHRTPFEAVGRLLLMSALMLFTSLLCYMLWTLWLDAVVPLATIVLTYLLVTQLAFTQQREKDRELLKRFIAPEFVDEMLERPAEYLGLGGKLSHVCILFADVRSFTNFAERHTPEQVFEAVNQYMTALTNALHAYGGVLDKYTGDGLMAWFPASPEASAQIEKAVKASLAMRDAVLEVSQTRAEQGKPVLHIGIGMHYGEAMIGLVGNEEHQINYTALGHAVIVSARLQSLAAGGEVIISEAIYVALGQSFQVEARAPVAVKGISELVHPYHVLSAEVPPSSDSPRRISS